jgi:23S rRNA pseudouridine2605 synthase
MRLRLQKFIAQSGFCSRRAAERLIINGKVLLNGSHIAQIGQSIDPAHDSVCIDGHSLKPLHHQYFLFHKPAMVLCSKKDPAGRSCFYDLLPSSMHHLVYAGRLDFMSEGLLILSNDGQFVHHLTHPRYGFEKTYEVWVKGIDHVDLFVKTIVQDGITDNGEYLKASHARILSTKHSSYRLEIKLLEGRNREIRRMVQFFKGKVIRLIRQQMGPYKLEGLECSQWRSFNSKETNLIDKILSNNKTNSVCHI